MERSPDHSQKNIKKNTLISLFSLFFQSGFSAVLGLVANLILTIVLPTASYGVYNITLAIIPFLNYFSDIGLAASLVQKKEISDEDIATTFTIQQILIITLLVIAFSLSSFIKDFYALPPEGIYLYWALLFAFFLSSLKTIPSIFLERKIQFQKIVLVQVVENIIFYITVSVLALAGMGLYSFAFAVIIRSLVGTCLMYYLSFWVPRFGIHKSSVKTLLAFGIPFQTNSLLALVKDDLIILFLGKILGLEAVGYIGWAKRWAEAPIRIIMDNINRILFPVFARIQTEKERISHLTEKILYFQTLIIAPIYVGMIILMDNVMYLIPKYSKWEPALPLFYIFCISSLFVPFSSPFINIFNALGKIKISFRFMVAWTTLTWILVPVYSHFFGMYGFPLAHLSLSLTFIVTAIVAKRIINFKLLPHIIPPFVSSALMGLAVLLVDRLPLSIYTLVACVIVGVSVYVSSMYFLFHKNIFSDIKELLKVD
jgi:O-antigen/teichoic acid export membrane protein